MKSHREEKSVLGIYLKAHEKHVPKQHRNRLISVGNGKINICEGGVSISGPENTQEI